jgi:anti-anti-sigma regulatory factor
VDQDVGVDQDIGNAARRPRADRFEIVVHHLRPAVVALRLDGDLDAAAAPELGRALDAAAADADTGTGPVRIAIDMEHVRRLTPEVVDVLVRVEQRIAAHGGVVQVYAMSPAVLLMLHEG